VSAWTNRSSDGKADPKIVPPRLRILCWKGLGADCEERHEPASDIDTLVAKSLNALDPNRPIKEADTSLILTLWHAVTETIQAKENLLLRRSPLHKKQTPPCRRTTAASVA
jgi:hypothetical protein